MRAVLCGYYGFGNGGDEALLATLLQMLPVGVEPLVMSADPAQTARRFGTPSLDRWSLLDVSRAIARSDAFIWGGGSLLQDVTGPANILYYGGLMRLAQGMGKKTIAWSQGLGPLKRPWSRAFACRTLAGCTAVTVRDRGSAELLSDWGIPFDLSTDPVWALAPATGAFTGELPEPWTAVVLRPHPELTPARLEVVTDALAQFQQTVGGSILLVPFQLPADEALARGVSERLLGASAVVQLEDPRQLMGLFHSVRFTISMRLHGVLMAAAGGGNVWGLIYDPKVAQLLDQIDAPGETLANLPEQPDVLSKLWLAHYANGSRLSPPQREAWVTRSQRNSQVLAQVLGTTR